MLKNLKPDDVLVNVNFDTLQHGTGDVIVDYF